MSVTLEQVEQLHAHAAVSYEGTRRALEVCDGDLLDALTLLERESRILPGGGWGAFFTTQSGAVPESPSSGPIRGSEVPGKDEKRFRGLTATAGGHRGRKERGSWRARLRELLAAAADLLHHCTVNQFEVWRNGERIAALSVLILILSVLVAHWISLPLLVVGLFFGYEYRFSSLDLDKNRVGEVVNQMSAKVGDAMGQVWGELKREFDKSKGKKGK